MIDNIIFFHRGCRLAFTTTFLRDVVIDRLRFGIARPRNRHHYRLLRDQIFTIKVSTRVNNIRTARVAKILTNLNHLIRDYSH